MNKLLITIENTGEYTVKDRYTIYMVTQNKELAEYTYKQLKYEYNEERRNASKV